MSTLNCGTLVDGWLVDKSTLRPISTARIAYVDTNGTGGALVNPADVANPWEPTIGEVPLSARYATPAAGYAAIRDGEADWLLFASGQTFDLGDSEILVAKKGASATDREVFSSFGTGAMPILTRNRTASGNRTIFKFNSQSDLHLDIAHIHFQSKELDSVGDIDDLLAVFAQNLSMTQDVDLDLAVEGCWIEGCEIIVEGTQPAATTKLTGPFVGGYTQRRCVTWNTHSSAILLTASDDVLFEENAYIDIGARRLQYLEDQGDTTLQIPQCCYVAENSTSRVATDQSHFRNNIFIDLASTAIQQRSGGKQNFNAYFRVPMWGFTGGGSTSERDGHGEVIGNVGIEGRDIDSTTVSDPKRGFGGQVGKLTTGTMSDNIIASNIGTGPFGFSLDGSSVAGTGTYTISRNIAWKVERALLLNGGSSSVATFDSNTFYVADAAVSTVQGNMIRVDDGGNDYWQDFTWTSNSYYSTADQLLWYSRTGGTRFADSFAEFVTGSGETGSIDATDPWVGSGTPNIATYLAANPSVLTKTLDGFKAAVKAQRYGNWDPRLTALHAVNFYRAGFGLDAVEFAGQTEAENASPQWQAIPRQSIAEGDSVALNLSSFVTDPDGDILTFAAVGTWPSWATLSGSTVTLAPLAGDASATNYELVVRATDDGSPIRTADATITATVTGEAAGDPPSGEANVPQYDMAIVSFVFFNGGKG